MLHFHHGVLLLGLFEFLTLRVEILFTQANVLANHRNLLLFNSKFVLLIVIYEKFWLIYKIVE